MQESRQFAEDGRELLQIDVHPAEENAHALALIWLIEVHRQVKRHHGDLMSGFAKLVDQSIVAETIAAVHPSGPWRYLDDMHAPLQLPVARAKQLPGSLQIAPR